MTYTAGSLFSGIGGIDLAFASAGFDVRFQVEIDPFCRQVLRKHAPVYWRNAVIHEDVQHVGRHNLEAVDCLFGGFPCQDISIAGERAGIKRGTKSGLWFEFARIISELRPRAVLLENSDDIVSLGGTTVIGDLAEMGYDAAWLTLFASDVDAPHSRERWFCVAWDVGNASSQRLQGNHLLGSRSQSSRVNAGQRGAYRQPTRLQQGLSRSSAREGRQLPQSRMGRNAYGLPARLDEHRFPAGQGIFQYDYEPTRVAERTPLRTAQIKALGNAVVPQVVYPLAVAVHAWLQAVDAQAESEKVA